MSGFKKPKHKLQKQRVQAMLSNETFEAIRNLAERNEVSVSHQTRRMLEHFLGMYNQGLNGDKS